MPIALILLLVGELEFLLVSNYDVRTEIRRLIPFPVYHNLLAFLAVILLTWRLSPRRFRGQFSPRLSVVSLSIHLACYLSIYLNVSRLYWGVRNWHFTVSLALLALVSTLFAGSWLLSWQSSKDWRTWFSRQRTWLIQALLASLLIPYLSEATASGWRHTAGATFAASDFVLTFLLGDTVASPDQLLLGTRDFVVKIEPGCSGYEGIGLIVSLLAVFIWIRRRELRLPQALWLFPVGAAISWLTNILRLVTLVVIGDQFSPEIAMRGFHSQAGWICFTLTGLAFIYGVEKAGWFRLHQTQDSDQTNHYPASVYLAPFICMSLGSLASEAFRADFNTWYALKPLAGILALLWFADKLKAILNPRFHGLDLFVGIGVYLIWMLLETPSTGLSPHDYLGQEWAQLWIFARLIGSVLVVPLIEELAFRGYLCKRLTDSEFERVEDRQISTPAIAISAVLFGLMHGNWLGGIVAGAAYGLLCRHQGRLSSAVVAHATTNACICLQVLTRKDWWLW